MLYNVQWNRLEYKLGEIIYLSMYVKWGNINLNNILDLVLRVGPIPLFNISIASYGMWQQILLEYCYMVHSKLGWRVVFIILFKILILSQHEFIALKDIEKHQRYFQYFVGRKFKEYRLVDNVWWRYYCFSKNVE